jgi:tetratricopeptide (TPR) repeat protein
MAFRPLALVFVTSLGSTLLFAQGASAAPNSNALVDGTRTAAPAQPPAPKPALSAEMRGDIFMARKMYREAIEAFKEGSPKDPVLWNKTGIAYHQMVQLDNARKSYEQALKLKPDYVEAMNNIGTIYYAKKSYRRAISWYDKALKTSGAQARAASIYMNMGTAFFARKRYQDATEAYQTALKMDPDVFEHHSSFGVMLEERTVEERAKYHYYVAKLYAKSGRSELALQYLRKALEEGFKERDKLAKDPEFATMRDTDEFKLLLASNPRVL